MSEPFKRPVRVDVDPRPGMEWNMEVVDANGITVAFMARPSGYDDDEAAEVIREATDFIVVAINAYGSSPEGETCPTCGTPVRVVSSDEGTSHYEPVGEALDTLLTKVEGEIDMVQGGGDYFDAPPSRAAYDKLANYALQLVAALRSGAERPPRVVLDDPNESAYYNARTCICGEDASAHIHPWTTT